MNMADGSFTRSELFAIVARLTFVTAIGYFGMRWLASQMDPTNSVKKKAKKKAEEQLRRIAKNNALGVSINTAQLSDHEMMIASHLVNPSDINVSWDNIAGLESVIQELKEAVVLPIQRKDLFEDSCLTRAPKGVLLHGPPGCGKTMIAKATAKETNTRFINLDVSILTDKWYGESQKLTAAVFSLAVKLQPCIIFIDEIDSFLRARNSTDHEATAMMKAQFMSLWDGLITDPNCTVIIMGATNRPQDLDKAILRRLPASFHIGLPNMKQRTQVLSLILANEPIADDINIEQLARMTEGSSCSDLHELCRNASMYRVRDFIRNQSQSRNPVDTDTDDEEYHDAVRPISMEDLVSSINKMRMSRVQTSNPMMKVELD